MFSPLFDGPGPWPTFVKRKDNVNLPLLEQRSKYLKEQLLFENSLISYQTLNTLSPSIASSTAAAGGGGPAPGGGGGPVPNPNFPLDNTSIVTAVALYFSDQAAAEAQYGLLNEWNTTGVTSMNRLFTTYLKPQAAGFNEDISGWDVSNVTDMTYMFYQQFDFNQPLGAWNVSSVTSFNSMFYNATSFNQDLSGWDLSSANNLVSIFFGATAFNNGGQALTWTMPSGGGFKQISSMFQGATSFNQDCSSWVVEGNINQIFYLASSFNNGGQPLTWDVSNVTSMNGLFQGTSFNQDISTWDVSNVTNMGAMFQNNASFNQDIGSWNFGAGLYDVRSMFQGATSFNQNLSGWVLDGVSMSNMFFGATAFNNGGQALTWTLSNSTLTVEISLNNLFRSATSFNQDVSSWDVSGFSGFNEAFSGATAFNQDISSWDVSNAGYREEPYYGKSTLKNIIAGSGMSTANYDALLIGWSALTFANTAAPNIELGAGTIQYSAGAAATARGVLAGAPNNFTITDGGQA